MPYIRDQPGLRRTNKGPRGTNQDPAIRIRVIWDGSGPAGPIKTPGWIGPRGTYQCPKWTSQGPAGRIMGPMGKTKVPQDESGPCWTDQAQRDQPRPHRTNQDTGTDRAPRDEPGPRRTTQSLWDTSGPWWMDQSPVNESGPQRDESGPRGTEKGPAGQPPRNAFNAFP